MTLNIEDSRLALIARLDGVIEQKLTGKEAKLVKDFLAQYYLGVSPYDLNERTLDELYGALMSQWHFLYQRAPGESKLRVYNPQIEEHGWESSHTIIEIVHENKPFLLDSIRLAINRLDINVRLMIHAEGVRFERDADNKVIRVLPLGPDESKNSKDNLPAPEAPIYIEIDRQSDNNKLAEITNSIEIVLTDVDLMVRDWSEMVARLQEAIDLLENDKAANANVAEIIKFLKWIKDDHFTFIGFAEYLFDDNDPKNIVLRCLQASGLGVLCQSKGHDLSRELNGMYPVAQQEILSRDIIMLGKTDTMSTVHRPVYTDFFAVKIFDAKGKIVKIFRFVGLYTSTVYTVSVDDIPFIRQKIAKIFDMARFPKNSHDGRALLHIIETLPRDEIFQASEKELYEVAIGVLHMQERQKIRLFIRRDTYGRFFSCLVYVPREIFNSQLRNKMQDILMHHLDGQSVDFDTKFSESVLARIHFIIRVRQQQSISYDAEQIQQDLVEASRSWNDDLFESLLDHFGEEECNALYKIYEDAFPLSYSEIFSAANAVNDIEHMEKLHHTEGDYLEMSLYRPIEDSEDSFRFKLFRLNKTIPLSDVVPILEKMGLRIISERPHEIKPANDNTVWINDYRMIDPRGQALNPEVIKNNFQEAFAAIWHSEAENDGFNRLVLSAQMSWRDISILRGYYRYMWQAGLGFSQNYVEDALYNNSEIAIKLIEYFYAKFDPQPRAADRTNKAAEIKTTINDLLDNVVSLNEDRILRRYLGTFEATVRTNYFQQQADGSHKEYISFKLDSAIMPELPLPKPIYEIFVYTTLVEGIHLRADKVARGGIRWSDRREDFRTEVLGLMKAQQVKNAVIVPLGAKGGFVVKQDLQKAGGPEQKNRIVIECYRTLIKGLLDLTDNYAGAETVSPPDTVCLDNADPYMVVAADKGTATFSDIANSISKEYNFWLGDAFASGGSTGYDHKKMAITSRGAWESVKIHFQRLNVDISTQQFTAIGIGDMAGDVFGNGMLQSDKMQLIAAFNHLHIFFDPSPDPQQSFKERKRLFDLAGSSWSDYDRNVISPGGGVFLRSAKKIPISQQMQQWLKCHDEFLEPNVLIRAILMLNVDLFFNGGIGTFVKAKSERNADVGDRANDALRVNGSQLNARVVCEGGNLGFTQLGRIEYAKKGGMINTDAIDNSGGVNCSDTEVNIKILLNAMVAGGDLTEKQRNQLLVNMTDTVAKLVINNNFKQNAALTLSDYQAAENLQMHYRLQKELERDAGLDPVVEFLPNNDEITARMAAGQGFTRPELAVLMAYTKILIKKELLKSTMPDEPAVEQVLINYFPTDLHEPQYLPYLKTHRLKRAIIATQISNSIVNEMGINFMQRLAEETSMDYAQIARAYMIARDVFEIPKRLIEIRDLGCSVSFDIQVNMWQDLNRLMRRTTRWFVRNLHSDISIDAAVNLYKPKVQELQAKLENILSGAWLEQMISEKTRLLQAEVPEKVAKIAASTYPMFSALDIVQATIKNNFDIEHVGKVYFCIGTQLQFGWFGELIKKQHVHNYWEALARSVFRDDLDKQQRHLAVTVIHNTKQKTANVEAQVSSWLNQHKELLQRWEFFISELKVSDPDFTMFAVALRELLDMSSSIGLIDDDVIGAK